MISQLALTQCYVHLDLRRYLRVIRGVLASPVRGWPLDWRCLSSTWRGLNRICKGSESCTIYLVFWCHLRFQTEAALTTIGGCLLLLQNIGENPFPRVHLWEIRIYLMDNRPWYVWCGVKLSYLSYADFPSCFGTFLKFAVMTPERRMFDYQLTYVPFPKRDHRITL